MDPFQFSKDNFRTFCRRANWKNS